MRLLASYKVPTKTQATKDVEKVTYGYLLKRFRRENGLGEDDENITWFIGWLVSGVNRISKSSWRKYKAAVLTTVEEQVSHFSSAVNPYPYVVAMEFLKSFDHPGEDADMPKRTARLKQKKISLHDLEKIKMYCDARKLESFRLTYEWLIAGVWLGLRPSEWRTATYVEGEDGISYLKVKNGKNTNGRSHGEYRHIMLVDFSVDEINLIKRLVAKFSSLKTKEEFARIYATTRLKLIETNKALWPNRKQNITLYSARHQFSANAKASGVSLKELAALMGHAVDDTALAMYARRIQGHSLIKVKGNEKDMERIKEVYMDKRYLPKAQRDERQKVKDRIIPDFVRNQNVSGDDEGQQSHENKT